MAQFIHSYLRKILPLFLCPTGYFTQISTLADVQENVMEYLHVLSRPKVIDREHDTVWTEAYIDSTVSWRFPYILYVFFCFPPSALAPHISTFFLQT